MKKQHVKLSEGDRTSLRLLVKKGAQSSRVYRRAIGLLELDRGKTLTAVAETTNVSRQTVSAWRNKYNAMGLRCLEDAPRSGRPVEISGEQRARITALACSEAPKGHAQWNLRLLAEKIVELGHCAHISHTQVRNILKKTTYNLT